MNSKPFTCSVSEYEQGILLLTIDQPEKNANVLTQQMFADLDEAWTEVEGHENVRGAIIISAKERIFVAGADLVAISETLDWSDEKIIEFCENGRSIFSRFSKSSFPVVAAIHGACVGGGFELTLWCDHRIATKEKSTVLGLPETKLGLLPGWAGTCILPRLIGVEKAAEMTALSELIDAETAADLGIVIKTVSRDELLSAAADLIAQENESKSYIKNRKRLKGPAEKLPADQPAFRESMVDRISHQHDVDNFAAVTVMDHILESSALPLDKACQQESLAMCQVYGSPTCAGLLNSFFLNDRARKSGKEIVQRNPAAEVKRIGVVGVGQMGRGLASLFLSAGFDVCIFDNDPQTLSAAGDELSSIKSAGRLTIAGTLDQMSECDLYIESIVENVQAKKDLFAAIVAIAKPDAVIATNTSVIRLSEMVDAVSNPARFCGMHFCSPVAISTLVEVIRAAQTSEVSLAAAISVSRKIRKNPIVLGDGPGFVVNRLLAPLFAEATRILIEGTDLQTIDGAMRHFGFPIGPFEMMDVIGTDIVFNAGKMSFNNNPKSVYLSPLLPKMVKKKWLGHKTGLGFYDYGNFKFDPYPPMSPLNPEVAKVIEEYRRGDQSISAPEIQNRIMLLMLQEACDLLSEQVADDPRDVDICLQQGLRFPANTGGLLYWADWIGIDAIVEMLGNFKQATDEDRFDPHPMLMKMDSSGSTFYGQQQLR